MRVDASMRTARARNPVSKAPARGPAVRLHDLGAGLRCTVEGADDLDVAGAGVEGAGVEGRYSRKTRASSSDSAATVPGTVSGATRAPR